MIVDTTILHDRKEVEIIFQANNGNIFSSEEIKQKQEFLHITSFCQNRFYFLYMNIAVTQKIICEMYEIFIECPNLYTLY